LKILLLGANGQVGNELRQALKPLGEVAAASRNGELADGSLGVAADLGDLKRLREVLDEQQPDVVVNAAAYTAVDQAETNESQAQAINASGPATLATWTAAHGALLVHYSTDYVFDGSSKRPYREDDATSPLGVYGRSKLAGEEALRAAGGAYLNLRTAWVYAARGHNFLLTMLRLGSEREQLKVVYDQVGAPTSARLLATATATAIRIWAGANEKQRSQLSGTYHLVAAGQTSWHGFAEAIFARATAKGLIARTPKVNAIGSAEFPTPAKRPAYSVLDNRRFQDTFDMTLPSWQDGLDEVIESIAASRASR
jgi:dTDP-4-dehydrorhamnose reductase